MKNTIKRLFLDIAGVSLCCVDFGGAGQPVLILHGLAGRGNEWRNTASWLTEGFHVYALDQRGHGMSEKELDDYSRDAYVRDCIAVIEHLHLAPVILIGQSMGGLNALLVAARRPELVRALIVVEAQAGMGATAQKDIGNWLARWSTPFPTLADAKIFFGGDTLYAETWIEMLTEHPDGYWPQFRVEDMIESLADAGADYWDEWEAIRCPILLVGGAKSFIPQDALAEMARRNPHASYHQIPDGGHDLHLEQPAAWRQIAEAFLSEQG